MVTVRVSSPSSVTVEATVVLTFANFVECRVLDALRDLVRVPGVAVGSSSAVDPVVVVATVLLRVRVFVAEARGFFGRDGLLELAVVVVVTVAMSLSSFSAPRA